MCWGEEDRAGSGYPGQRASLRAEAWGLLAREAWMTPGFQLSKKVALLLFILPILEKAEDKACTAGLEESG